MKALSKQVERKKDMNIAAAAAETFLLAALLTADDIFGLNEELTQRFVNGYAEMINGYAECGGMLAMRAELVERGIQVSLDGKPVK